MAIHGVDVSQWQEGWKPNKWGDGDDDFVFIKATEGSTHVDPEMDEHYQAARDAGLVIGFYHFQWPGGPKDEAKWFVDHLPSGNDPVMLACDWEGTSGGTASGSEKDTFMAEVKRLRPDCRVGPYTFCSLWNSSNKNEGDFLWIAHPDTSTPCTDNTFWQYTWEPLDQNWANFASRAELRDWVEGSAGGGSGEGLFGMTTKVYERRATDQ